MNKHLMALIVMAAVSSGAAAQSGVTLFGVVDLGARYIDNASAGSYMTVSSDGIASSRLGFRGTEDLGGGLRAGFWIEGQLVPDSGAGNQTWARRSTVSLLGQFGELRLGRDYVPDFWNHSIFDPFGTNGVGSSINVIGSLKGTNTFVRADNSVGYFLPALGGLYGQLMVAAGEGAVGNKHAAGRVGYAAGPFNAAIAYGQTSIDDAREWKRWNIGASYNFGFATLMALFIDTEATETGAATQARRSALVGAVIPVGDVMSLKFSAIQTDGRESLVGRDSTQLALGVQYDLSQRTALYANAAQIRNEGTSGSVVTLSGPSGMKAGETSTGFEFGLRHVF